MKRCLAVRGYVPCGLPTVHICVLYVLKTLSPSRDKVVSLPNITDLGNCGSAACWCSVQKRHVAGDHPAIIIELTDYEKIVRLRLAERVKQLIDTFLWQRQAMVHSFRDFSRQHATDTFPVWVLVLFASARYFHCYCDGYTFGRVLMYTYEHLMIFQWILNDLLGALLDIFPDTTGQQCNHFHWLGHIRNVYPLTQRLSCDLCWSHSVNVYNKEAAHFYFESSRTAILPWMLLPMLSNVIMVPNESSSLPLIQLCSRSSEAS